MTESGGPPPLPGDPIATAPQRPVPPLPGHLVHPDQPATRRPRSRRTLVLTALVAALAAAAALLVWAATAPHPPLQPPRALTSGPATTGSVQFRWSLPAGAPAPAQYLISRDGRVIAHLPASVTRYRDTGLDPDTGYRFRVTSADGTRRSPPSALLTLSTATPPLSAARLAGDWQVAIVVRQGAAALRGPDPPRWTESWQTSPACPAGPCTVRATGVFSQGTFRTALARSGAAYTASLPTSMFRCGTVPVRSTMTIRLAVRTAFPYGRAWLAGSWAGTLVITSRYTSAGDIYCPAFQLTATLAGWLVPSPSAVTPVPGTLSAAENLLLPVRSGRISSSR
jgi:hypothetical protein